MAPAVPLYASFAGSANFSNGTSANCRGEHEPPNELIKEYVDYKAGFVPACGSFVSKTDFPSKYPLAHFTFEMLNTSTIVHEPRYKDWAIVLPPLDPGLNAIRLEYGHELVISSAYRTPLVQHDLDVELQATDPTHKLAHSSRHVHGDAADIDTGGNTLVLWTPLRNAARSANPIACIEPSNVSGFKHVHVDWRPSADCIWPR